MAGEGAAASRHTAVVADDHSIVRHALRLLLERVEGLSVVAEAANGLEAISLVKSLQPSLLMLDHAMPFAQGIEVFSEVRRWSPDTKVVVLTGLTARGLLAEFVSAGVDGLFLKRGDETELVSALPRVLSGESYTSAEVSRLLESAGVGSGLTLRELQILSRIADGQNNGEISDGLNISPKTVDNHRTNLMRKLGVHSVAELIAYALREGLLDTAKHL